MSLECDAQTKRLFAEATRMQDELRSKVHNPQALQRENLF